MKIPSPRSFWRWFAAVAALGGVFLLYAQSGLIVDMANFIWSCA